MLCRTKSSLYYLLFAGVSFSCSAVSTNAEDPTTEEDVVDPASIIDTRIPVKVKKAEIGDFPVEILTNGTIEARQQVEIKIRSSGRIVDLPVADGSFVKRGALLYRQDASDLRLQLEQDQINTDEARARMDELLILQGGVAGDTTSVDPQKFHNIKINSGWTAAQQREKQTRYDMSERTVYAPFSGLAANVKLQKHQEAQAGEVLCTLINTGSFEVIFTLLEKDLAVIERGQSGRVQPVAMAGESLTAEIDRINPVIDEHGLLTVSARITGSKKRLFTGMKCRVILEKRMKDQLIVPKAALVIRSNRDVIFVIDTLSGLAKWKYVVIGQENSESLAVTEGLALGDLVITEGNLNLAHDAEVVFE